jgi:hypothetical protein
VTHHRLRDASVDLSHDDPVGDPFDTIGTDTRQERADDLTAAATEVTAQPMPSGRVSQAVDRKSTAPAQTVRVCTVVASFAGFRSEHGNASRLAVAFEVLAWAASCGVTLVAFPAGFLRASSESPDAVVEAAAGIVSVAERAKVAVLVGVDACPPDWEDTTPRDPSVSLGALPYYAVAKSLCDASPLVFRQRSTTQANWKLAPTGVNDAVYRMTAGATPVAVVLCGELFSPPVLTGLTTARPPLAVIAAHWTGKGLRKSRGTEEFSKVGVPMVRAVHARSVAENVLWKAGSKVAPTLGDVRFRDGDFEATAGVFEV